MCLSAGTAARGWEVKTSCRSLRRAGRWSQRSPPVRSTPSSGPRIGGCGPSRKSAQKKGACSTLKSRQGPWNCCPHHRCSHHRTSFRDLNLITRKIRHEETQTHLENQIRISRVRTKNTLHVIYYEIPRFSAAAGQEILQSATLKNVRFWSRLGTAKYFNMLTQGARLLEDRGTWKRVLERVFERRNGEEGVVFWSFKEGGYRRCLCRRARWCRLCLRRGRLPVVSPPPLVLPPPPPRRSRSSGFPVPPPPRCRRHRRCFFHYRVNALCQASFVPR